MTRPRDVNLVKSFKRCHTKARKARERDMTQGIPGASQRHDDAILGWVAENITRYGAVTVLRFVYAFYHTHPDTPTPPSVLEPFIMKGESHWLWLSRLTGESYLWKGILAEHSLDEEVFEVWSGIKIDSLNTHIEDIFVRAVKAEIIRKGTGARIEPESLLLTRIRLTERISFSLPMWEAKAILEKRFDEIIESFRH